MIALLSQAFAGQGLTPADIAGRLLATSYNQFAGFTKAGTRDFGNGVTHDYSSSYGHGIPDMLAALQPVVSNTAPLAFITSGDPVQGTRVPVQASGVLASSAFGDSLRQGLSNVSVYSFDALGAGFPVAMQALTRESAHRPALRAQSLPLHGLTTGPVAKLSVQSDYIQGLVVGRQQSIGELASQFSPHSSSSLLSEAQGWWSLRPVATGAFTESVNASVGVQAANNLQVFGYSSSSLPSAIRGSFESHGLAASPEANVFGVTGVKAFSSASLQAQGFLAFDYRHEFNAAKGAQSSGALQVADGLQSLSLTPGFRFAQSNWQVSALASFAVNKPSAADESLAVVSVDGPYLSSGLVFRVDRYKLAQSKDAAYFQLWQPERVEKVRLKVRQALPAGLNSNLGYTESFVTAQPSGREIALGLGYSWAPGKTMRTTVEYSVVSQANHQADQGLEQAVRVNWILPF
jgi:hypothetical protein